MKIVAALVASLAVLCQYASAEELGRFNLEGRTIVIDSDGTWSYVEAVQTGDCTELSLAQPNISFCLNESFWRRAEVTGAFKLSFQGKNQEIYLGVVGEPTTFEMDAMRELIRKNASDTAGLKGLMNNSDDTVSINGQDWGIVRFDLEYGSALVKFENYFTVVPGQGTAQFVFWATQDVFETTAEVRERIAQSFKVVE